VTKSKPQKTFTYRLDFLSVLLRACPFHRQNIRSSEIRADYRLHPKVSFLTQLTVLHNKQNDFFSIVGERSLFAGAPALAFSVQKWSPGIRKRAKNPLTSLSLLSLLNSSSDSNLLFWSGTTRGILKMNLGLGCSYRPMDSKGSIPARADVGSFIECISLDRVRRENWTRSGTNSLSELPSGTEPPVSWLRRRGCKGRGPAEAANGGRAVPLSGNYRRLAATKANRDGEPMKVK
jgi:hypothetical protein